MAPIFEPVYGYRDNNCINQDMLNEASGLPICTCSVHDDGCPYTSSDLDYNPRDGRITNRFCSQFDVLLDRETELVEELLSKTSSPV